MKKRDVCGVLVLLVYLMGVGLVTGPSLYQLLAGKLPEPKLELIPFADIIAVLREPDVARVGRGREHRRQRRAARAAGPFCCRCFGGISAARSAPSCSGLAYRSASS